MFYRFIVNILSILCFEGAQVVYNLKKPEQTDQEN